MKRKFERQIIEDVFNKCASGSSDDTDVMYFYENRYKLIKKLGKRLFGTVFLVEDQKDYKWFLLTEIFFRVFI